MTPLQDIALNDMIDLVKSCHIPCGIFDYVHRPVAISDELGKIMTYSDRLVDILDAKSIKSLPQAFGYIGNMTLSSTPIREVVYLIDIYYFGRNNTSNYLATFRDSKSSDSYKYFKEIALIQSNLQKTSEIIQDISMASNNTPELIDNAKDTLKYIHTCTYRLMRYHTDMKILNNIIFNIMPINLYALDPVKLIKSIIKSYKEINPESKAKFHLECENTDLSVYCDRQMMTRALSNIFANIMFLTQHSKPEINISIINLQNQYTKISVKCPKLKLTKKEIDMLMTGDFTSEKKHATYDGLYISNSIIIQHNGTFNIISNKDAGTTINIGLFENIPKMKFRDSAIPDDAEKLNEIITAEFMM